MHRLLQYAAEPFAAVWRPHVRPPARSPPAAPLALSCFLLFFVRLCWASCHHCVLTRPLFPSFLPPFPTPKTLSSLRLSSPAWYSAVTHTHKYKHKCTVARAPRRLLRSGERHASPPSLFFFDLAGCLELLYPVSRPPTPLVRRVSTPLPHRCLPSLPPSAFSSFALFRLHACGGASTLPSAAKAPSLPPPPWSAPPLNSFS